ncbi:hypothetical protein JAAARDRAFT_532783 [Jaapia argillacea MUCL 33604]|uniref:Fungal lipase-type domain-containing protein n=1 Tax=Jaapia argillacea MUCL 33604 TaxID=933084 RepID=A0A067PLM1_9AGAM|nr:hypothetical protein JAAARDRAFT_532783 [Jaapia argillacea MUCL 33604]
MAKLDIFQQVFALSQASNLVGGLTGTEDALQAEMDSLLPQYLRKVTGDWKVVWGPTVWKIDANDSTTSPGNVWYVAKSEATDGTKGEVYVVAIAATAGANSQYDWEQEDISVSGVVDFSSWKLTTIPGPEYEVDDKKNPYISLGTATGVYFLASTPAPQSHVTLPEFLSSLVSSPSTKLIFTGHSLGGALAPTLALALVQDGTLGQFKGKVLAYPTAGATPGNQNFADLFAKTFPRDGQAAYTVWNTNIYNTLDVVPQAWSLDTTLPQNMWNIPGMYGGNGLVQAVVKAIVQSSAEAPQKSGIHYFPLQSSPFTGEAPTPPTDLQGFLADALFEHMDAYGTFFDLPFPQPLEGLGSVPNHLVQRGIPVIGEIATAGANMSKEDVVGLLDDSISQADKEAYFHTYNAKLQPPTE